MSENAERIRRANEMAGGKRAQAALLLMRWAGVLRGLEPAEAAALERMARDYIRREVKVIDQRRGGGRLAPNWRIRQLREAVRAKHEL